MRLDRTMRGVLLSFASFAVFSLSDTSVKLIRGGLPPYESAFVGALFGLAVLPFVCRPGQGVRDIFVTRSRSLWLVRFLSYPATVIGSVTAFTHLPMAEALALMFLLPTFLTILSRIFLKERVDWRGWAAVAIGFLGVLVVLRPGFRALSIGHLGAFVTGLASAIKVVTFRAGRGGESSLSLYGACILGGVVICGLCSLTDFTWPDGVQWVKLAGYGLLAALGNVLSLHATRHAPAASLGPTQYSQMLWAILLGRLLFGDVADLPTLLGIVLIILSGLMTLLPRRGAVVIAH